MSKKLDIQIISAASILGLKPSGVQLLPAALLSNGLKEKLHSNNPIIDVPTLNHLYHPERSKETGLLNGESLKAFSISLKDVIQKFPFDRKFALVLGGDCSILIGIMLALKSQGNYGLFFMDAHADFYEPEKSITGEVADMDLAFITGRGPEILTNIDHSIPYVRDENVVHIGQRDMEETEKYNAQEIRSTCIKRFDLTWIQHHGLQKTMKAIETYVARLRLDGFWIHFDTDVIEDSSNPAVDYRLEGGLSFPQCEGMLRNLISNYNILGMSVTIFNPTLDVEGKIARQLTQLLSDCLAKIE